MKRLIQRKSYDNKDVRDFVLKTTPIYPYFESNSHDDIFKNSDEKSFSKLINDYSNRNK